MKMEGLQRHIAGDLAILIEDGIAVLVLKLKKRGFPQITPFLSHSWDDHPCLSDSETTSFPLSEGWIFCQSIEASC